MTDSANGRKTTPYLWIAAAVLFVVLAVIAAVRLHAWHLQAEDRKLLALANPWNPVSEIGYNVRLTDTGEGVQADRACADALKTMLKDCRAAGCKPKVMAGFRSVDDQLVLYDEEVQRLVDSGSSPEEAERTISLLIAPAGRSEHELGLAFDLIDADSPSLDETQADTPTGKWLAENSWKYGFILRYPQGREEITGYSWHPWHYRYVGEDAAANIHSLGITLEEYLSLFYSDEAQVEVAQG